MTGMSAADGPLHVDELASFARRDGDQIRVVLRVAADPDLQAEQAFVRFQGPDSAARAAAVVTPDGDAYRVEARVPEVDLGVGVWRLKFRPSQQPLRNLQTRLVIADGIPLALLPGRSPDTRMPEPAPR